MNHVWTYWEGEMLSHVEVGLATGRAIIGDHFHVVTPETLPGLLPDIDQVLHPRWREVKECGPRICTVRAALLYRYGGLWADADTIWLRSPEALPPMKDCLYTMWPPKPVRVISGYLAAPKGSPVIKAWIDANNWKLEHDFENTGWLQLSEKTLTPSVRNHDLDKMTAVDYRTFLPHNIDQDPWAMVKPGDWQRFLRPETICFGLNNSWWATHEHGVRPLIAAMSAWEQSQSRMCIHRLLTHARTEILGQTICHTT